MYVIIQSFLPEVWLLTFSSNYKLCKSHTVVHINLLLAMHK